MKKLNKTLPLILCVIMTAVFYYFSSRWAAWGDMDGACNFIFKGIDGLPLNMMRIIATLFFAVMHGAVILLTDSKWLPYVYMGILLIGTIIAKEKFLYIAIFAMGIMSFLVGAIVEMITGVISFVFPGFAVIGIWIVRIAQLIAHCGMIALLTFPQELFKEDQKSRKSSSSGRGSGILEELNEGLQEYAKEQREAEKLETLKDIEWELKRRR